MKTYKTIPIFSNNLLSSYSGLTKSLTPRMTVLDGFQDLLNLKGNYYDTGARMDALCNASKQIASVSQVWGIVGRDLYKATEQFAKMHAVYSTRFNPMPLPSYDAILRMQSKRMKLYSRVSAVCFEKTAQIYAKQLREFCELSDQNTQTKHSE